MTGPEPASPLRDADPDAAPRPDDLGDDMPSDPAGSVDRDESAAAVEAADSAEEPAALDPRTVAQRVQDVCPFLLSEDGASRRLGPWRGHRCAAVRPPARLALDKQKRLCLVADHLTCATYLAAHGSGGVAALPLASSDLERVTRWSITRTTSSVVEPGSRLDGLASRLSGTAAQAILGGALLVALLAMARGQVAPGAGSTASPTPGGSGSASASASVGPSASAAPSTTPAPTDVAEITPAPSPPPPTPVPSPVVTPLPAGSATYTVRAGDTLWDIAVAYNTTVKALQELNGLGPNSRLHIGQKLQIP